MRRVLVTIGLMAALATATTACGKDTKEKASDTTAATSAQATSAPGATVDTKFTGKGSAQFCALAKTYGDKSGQLVPSLNNPAQLRTLFKDLQAAVKQAVDVAPSEIKSDVTLLAGFYNDFATALDKVNYDFTKVPPDISRKLQDPQFQAAATRLDAYTKQVCGLNP
jgi:hypothetical protein